MGDEFIKRLRELVKKWRYQIELRKVWMVQCCADALEKAIDEQEREL